MHQKKIVAAGKSIDEAGKVLIMIHGRGGSAEDILSLRSYFDIDDFALLAPQASGNTWYPYSFLATPSQNEPKLSSALAILDEVVSDVHSKGIAKHDIYFLGFSQGACLALEYVTRNASKYGGVVALSGGLIGDRIYGENYKGDFQQTPFFIGSSNPDPHIPVERVYASANIIRNMNGEVKEVIYDNMGHTICQDEIEKANTLVFSKR